MRNFEQQQQFELSQNERLKKDIHRLQQSAQRTAVWSDRVEATKTGSRNSGLRPDRGYIGHRSAKMMQRAKSIDTRRQKALEEASGLPVILWDERRSTIEAHAILHAAGKKEKKHRANVDAVAATLLLEGYLASPNR